jgi:CHAT domain-containing protein
LERQIGQEYRARAPHLLHHASLPQPTVKGRIPQDTILLDYYCTAEEIHLFLVTNSEVHTFPGITSTIAVERLVNQWRFNLDSMRVGTLKAYQALDLADQAYAILQHLEDLLLAPVREHLEGYRRLWIVPHGLLWEIPFAALYDGERCLIDRWQLTVIPGWVERTREAISAPADLLSKPVIVGHTNRGRLQYTLEEARTVAAMVDTSPLIEEAATIARVRQEAETCTLLHVATHGWFRSDAPLFSVIHLADGAVTVKDLETWNMPAIQLVTLSACETGRSLNRGSDLLGISRSLFKAGARRLLVSLWAVDDVATTELMVRFYQRLRAKESLATAWQAAQRAALGKYRHPFYWAGFVLLSLA